MSEQAIEGLLGKGLIKEKYDTQKDDLIRNLTPEGFLQILNLLKDPLWRRVYLLMKRGATEEQINQVIKCFEKQE